MIGVVVTVFARGKGVFVVPFNPNEYHGIVYCFS